MLKRKIWQELLKLLLSLTRQCLPLSSINQFLGLLPWEDVTTKMTICARPLVDRVTEIKLPERKKKKPLVIKALFIFLALRTLHNGTNQNLWPGMCAYIQSQYLHDSE